MKKGFTLIESLVVIAIIAILSVIVFPYYHSAREQLALQRSANKLAQDIRKVQGMALGAEEIGGQVPVGGYGMYLRKARTFYVLFADTNNDKYCDGCNTDPPSGEAIIPPGKIYFEQGIEIKDLDEVRVNIIFKPPDPTTYFTDKNGEDLHLDEVSIKISLISDETKTKTIKVNKAGLIFVE